MVIHKVQKLRKYSMAVQVLGKQSSLERRTRLLGGNSDPVVLGMLSVQIWAGEHDLGVHLLFVLCSLLLSLNNNREQRTNNQCTPRSCSPAQIYTENIPSTTESLLPPNSRVLLLSREDCLPKTCTAIEYFLSF